MDKVRQWHQVAFSGVRPSSARVFRLIDVLNCPSRSCLETPSGKVQVVRRMEEKKNKSTCLGPSRAQKLETLVGASQMSLALFETIRHFKNSNNLGQIHFEKCHRKQTMEDGATLSAQNLSNRHVTCVNRIRPP